MNLPNKITMVRIFLAVLVIVLLMFPFSSVGIDMPLYTVGTNVIISLNYIIAGVLFVIASITDFIDGNIARKNNLVTDFGKVMDAIADKVLVNGVLIIFAYNGNIPLIIPVVIILRDTIVDTIKMVAGNKGRVIAAIKTGKIKTACMMVGITLTLFYNLPFELWNFRLSDALLILAAILSIVSAIEYFNMNKDLIFADQAKKEELETK